MNDLHEDSKEIGEDILEYLSSLRLLSSDLDVEVNTVRYSGCIQVRGGVVTAASQGGLSGNGALFTLVTQRVGDIKAVKSVEPLVSNVTVNHEQIAFICSKVSTAVGDDAVIDEAELLEEAIHLFLQFRRKEAGAKIVEVLRSNRFYYPAWLWHSRLMNRVEYLGKAIKEMKKWGGHDSLVKGELAKIEPHLLGRQEDVKRCIFCWAIVEKGQKQCRTCNCLLSISAKGDKQLDGRKELEASLRHYENEFKSHPENSRIAYCLCLGKFSLGQTAEAQGYLDKALRISPSEQLFLRTSKFLHNISVAQHAPDKEKKREKVEAVSVPSCQPSSVQEKNKTILVIEDSTTSRKVISLVLKRQGYTIIEAHTGSEGLARLIDLVPDLVLLDVMLPDMEGYQILSEIRSNTRLKEVPVVMLTGKNSSVDRMKGFASGANEYLTKPFDPAKLLKVLERFTASGGKKSVSTPVKNAPVGKRSHTVKKTRKADIVLPSVGGAPPKPAVTPGPSIRVTPPKPAVPSGPSILIVEDSPTTRKVISIVLTRKGYPFREATTGKEALLAIEAAVPDLILLDAMLPDMTGYDILVDLQKSKERKKIPVVMLTAKAGAADRQKGMQAGAVAYLTKPFDPDKLLSTVAQHMPVRSSATI